MLELHRSFILFGLCLFLGLSGVNAQEKDSPLPSSFSLEWKKSKTFTIPSVRRFLVMDPTRAQVTLNGDELEIRAIQIGETSILIWTAETRYVTRLKITFPKRQISHQQRRLEGGRKKNRGISGSIGYAYRASKSGPSYGGLKKNGDPTKNLDLDLNLPLMFSNKKYFINSSVSWDLDNKKLELGSWNGGIRDVQWPASQKYDIQFGSIQGISAPFVQTGALKGIRVAPLKFKIPKKSFPVVAEIVAGELDDTSRDFGAQNFSVNALPGDLSKNDESKTKYVATQFSYPFRRSFSNSPVYQPSIQKTNVSPNTSGEPVQHSPFSYTLTALHVDQPQVEDGITELASLEVVYRKKGRNAIFSMGGDLNHPSYVLQARQRWGKNSAQAQRTFTPINALGSRGPLRGSEANQVSYIHSRDEFMGILDKFSFSLGGGSSRNERLNRETKEEEFGDWIYSQSASIRFDLYDNRLGLRYQRSDSTNTVNPVETNNVSLSANRKITLFDRPVRLGAQYDVTSIDRINNSALSTDSRNWAVRGNVFLFKWLSYGVGYRVRENEKALGEKSRSKNISHSLSTHKNFFENRILGSLSYSYANSTSDSDFSLFSSNTETQAVTLGLGGHPVGNTSYRFQYQVLFQDSNVQRSDDQVSSRLEASVNTRFHTLLGWKPATVVDVLAYLDNNGNGSFDPIVDHPLVFTDVIANGKVIGQTDKEGYLKNQTIRGWERIIKLDNEQIPTGYVFSTSSYYEFSNNKKTHEVCEFGLALNTELSGVVYNDLNGDGLFDGGDIPLQGVVVFLSNGDQKITDRHGRFYFKLLSKGDYEVKISPLTIPLGYRSTSSMRRSVTIEKGSVVQLGFSFNAQRVLKGRVIVTKERKYVSYPVSNALIQVDTRETHTNHEGYFRFKQMGPGRNLLTIHIPESLQEKVEETSPLEFPVNFSREPENKTNITIVLTEKK